MNITYRTLYCWGLCHSVRWVLWILHHPQATVINGDGHNLGLTPNIPQDWGFQCPKGGISSFPPGACTVEGRCLRLAPLLLSSRFDIEPQSSPVWGIMPKPQEWCTSLVLKLCQRNKLYEWVLKVNQNRLSKEQSRKHFSLQNRYTTKQQFSR